MEYTIDTFDWEFYIGEYVDLRNAGILTKEKAFWHWRTYGCKENRRHRKIFINEDKTQNTNHSLLVKNKLTINKNIKISIVMAYYNRKSQTLETLKNFEKMYASKYNFEVIIVDDNSNDKNRLEEDIKQFTFSINLITISKDEKNNRINSCSVYNKGFNEAQGEIIIIQNPECIHMGNIFDYIEQNFSYDKYLSFPCYNSNNYEVNEYIYKNYENLNILNIENKTKHFNEDINVKNWPKWYQHPETYNKNLHFCTAIYKEYLQMIGGFSECFKDGVCYEDDDILFKIKNILKLDIVAVPINDNVGVVHLFHGRSAGVNISPNEKDIKKRGIWEKFSLNKSLFERHVKINHEFPTPKIFHYYWDDFKKFSYLNLYSLKSSVHYHPDFIHIIWCPYMPEKNITWDEFCNKEFNSDDSWEKYVKDIKKMTNVKIIYKDISKFIDVNSEMSEIHKSDLFRYKILCRYGGIWSDLDIVYIKSITDVINFNFDTINFLCKAPPHQILYMPIGLMLSKRKAPLFNTIFEIAKSNYNPDRYQSVGAEVFTKIFFNTEGKNSGIALDCGEFKKLINPNSEMLDFNNSIFNLHYTNDNLLLFDHNSGEKNVLLNEKYYMYLNWTKIDELFISNTLDIIPKETVGFHWFNGSNETKKYLTEIIEYKIPNKFKGAVFKEKNKFHSNIKKVIYFDINVDSWATFYINKKEKYLNLLNLHCDNISSKYISNLFRYDYMLNLEYDECAIYMFDELSYNHLLGHYKFARTVYKRKIIDFLNNAKYFIFFCELFENDYLQTIGNKIQNLEFATLFFKNAQNIFLCNTKNINYLYKNNIYNNITYFPPLGYSNILKNTIKNQENQTTDILFYGNIIDDFYYRKSIINKINKFSKKEKYRFIVKTDLYMEEQKNKMLQDTKIVIHIPSHENLHSFPWAKVCELILKKVFFIIEENEEMYIQGLDKLCVFYKRNDAEDLKNKIHYYIDNPEERDNVVNKCYTYFKKNYNMDNLFEKLFK
tara:strand:+ start:284 stop:3280 length:2997 start_codon:yes stop_codon:yes gene_type:complete